MCQSLVVLSILVGVLAVHDKPTIRTRISAHGLDFFSSIGHRIISFLGGNKKDCLGVTRVTEN